MKRIPPESIKHLAWKNEFISYSGLFHGRTLEGGDYNIMVDIEQVLGIAIKNQKIVTGDEPGYVEENGRVISLGLGNQGLSRLPPSIGGLQSLRRLRVDYNEIKELPVEIGNLRNLISLNVQSNPLHNLPKSIGRLQSLRSFNASSCELEQIPDELGTIMTLERISLTHNRLRSLPDSIGQLPILKALRLNANPLGRLPTFSNFALNVLELGNINLCSVPESLYAIRSLRKLVLRWNNLESISPSIANLASLRELDLSHCGLKSFPDAIKKIPNLVRLDISHNQFVLTKPVERWVNGRKKMIIQ